MIPVRRLPVFLSCMFATLAGPALAGLDDPFATGPMAPLKASASLSARVADAPCATALPAAPLTALAAVDLALCQHPQTREMWAAARVQAAQVGLARAAWLPTIAARGTTARQFAEARDYNQQSASLTLSWLLFDAGQRAANGENAQQLLNAALATQDATVQALFLAALQAFYSAQATQAAVVSAIEAERAARESFQAAEARYAVGAGTPADRLQAQTAYSQATLNRIKAEGEARNALGTLANALGFEAPQKIVLAAPAVLPTATAFQKDVDALIHEARERRPDLKAAEAQLKAAEAGIEAARAQGRPTVSLGAGPSWQDVGGVVTRGSNVGLTLNVPLFSGFDTTYRVRSAAAQAEVRAAQRDRLRNQVALDVWKTYQNLNTATQSLRTAADLVASAEQSAQVALGRYKAGVGTVLDLLAAQSALASARLQRIQAEFDWHVNRAALAQAMGALDDTLLLDAAGDKP